MFQGKWMYTNKGNICLLLLFLLLSGCSRQSSLAQLGHNDKAQAAVDIEKIQNKPTTDELAPPSGETVPVPVPAPIVVPVDEPPPVIHVPSSPPSVFVPVYGRGGGGGHKPRLPCENGTSDCNDKNPCTVDTCVEDICVHTLDTSKDEFGSCEMDGSSCTIGKCIQSVEEIICLEQRREFIVGELGCQDDNQCTTDSCIEVPISHAEKSDKDGNVIPDNEHQCVQEVVIGLLCNLDHECLRGFCQQSGTGMTPQDPFVVTCVIDETAIPVCPATNNPCTQNVCDVEEGCLEQNLPADTPCNDNDPCTMNDVCNNAGLCGGMLVVCPSDNNPCTDDLCKTGTGCIYPPTTEEPLPQCSDNNECTINDACSDGECVGQLEDCAADPENPCQIGFCDVTAGCQTISLTGPYGEDCQTPYLGICAMGAIMCLDGELTTMCEPLVRPGDKEEVCDPGSLDENCDGVVPPCEDFTFAFSNSYMVNDQPESVALGDVDGDNDIDIIVAITSTGNVSVFLNNGDGIFATPIDYAADLTPRSVAVGDVDNDNDLDVVVANRSSHNVSVLINNGSGMFAAPVNYAADIGPESVALGFLNGDNFLDIVVANSLADNVSVLLNDGDGTFEPKVDYATVMVGGTESVALGDVNGDTSVDIVVANLFTDNISVLLNNGSGAFGAASNFAAGDGPDSVALGDLEGDNDLDIVVVNFFSGDASVLINNGAGAFAAPVSYAMGNVPRSVALGDLDNDGDLDMVAANFGSNNVARRLNNGDGTFGAASISTVGNRPLSVALGFLNDDNLLDLAVANSSSIANDDNVAVLFGRCLCSPP